MRKFYSMKMETHQVYSRIGRSNEDRYSIATINTSITMYAVFDGHGGSKTAEYLRDNLANCLMTALNQINPDDPEQMRKALIDSFLKVDRQLYDLGYTDGSTAAIVLVTPRHVYLVSVGDSRCILYHEGVLIGASRDAKPGDPSETFRITKLGGTVYGNPPRVMGRLAVSRAFGDFDLKIDGTGNYNPRGYVSVEPYTQVYIRPKNFHLLVASDGLWDAISSEEAALYPDSPEKSRILAELALSRLNKTLLPEQIDDITILMNFV